MVLCCEYVKRKLAQLCGDIQFQMYSMIQVKICSSCWQFWGFKVSFERKLEQRKRYTRIHYASKVCTCFSPVIHLVIVNQTVTYFLASSWYCTPVSRFMQFFILDSTINRTYMAIYDLIPLDVSIIYILYMLLKHFWIKDG